MSDQELTFKLRVRNGSEMKLKLFDQARPADRFIIALHILVFLVLEIMGLALVNPWFIAVGWLAFSFAIVTSAIVWQRVATQYALGLFAASRARIVDAASAKRGDN